mmetsp:Transcript_5043/g.12730  ORF Transcript_5043/g.12730 Transcript_5043/m.12730 type:complete len:312 (-) Transcript_5043:3400-4335(-)
MLLGVLVHAEKVDSCMFSSSISVAAVPICLDPHWDRGICWPAVLVHGSTVRALHLLRRLEDVGQGLLPRPAEAVVQRSASTCPSTPTVEELCLRLMCSPTSSTSGLLIFEQGDELSEVRTRAAACSGSASPPQRRSRRVAASAAVTTSSHLHRQIVQPVSSPDSVLKIILLDWRVRLEEFHDFALRLVDLEQHALPRTADFIAVVTHPLEARNEVCVQSGEHGGFGVARERGRNRIQTRGRRTARPLVLLLLLLKQLLLELLREIIAFLGGARRCCTAGINTLGHDHCSRFFPPVCSLWWSILSTFTSGVR